MTEAKAVATEGTTVNSGSKSAWNSLEATKILVSSATPILILIVGALLSQQNAKQAAMADRQAKLQGIQSARYESVIKKRVELWDTLGPRLSRLTRQVYFFEQKLPPAQAREMLKSLEECDILVDAYRPYFTTSFVDSYAELSRLLTLIIPAEASPTGRTRLFNAYNALVTAATNDLALKGERAEAEQKR